MNTISTASTELQKKHSWLTVPNLLSFLRLGLIPVFVRLYLEGDYAWTCIVLILSGITDVADGFIARKFHAISNLGKFLDPLADKLTQAAILCCLMSRFALMRIVFAALVLKELCISLTGFLLLRQGKQIYSADWHGKLNTVVLNSTALLHVFWPNILHSVSCITSGLCLITITISAVLYSRCNLKLLHKA